MEHLIRGAIRVGFGASWAGALATVAFAQAPATISGVTLNPGRVTGGATVTGTVTLNADAGQGGVAVKVESGNPAMAKIPQAIVVIPSGARSTNFTIQTRPVAGNPNVAADPPFVDITVWRWAAGGGPGEAPHPIPPSITVRLTVLPPALASLTLRPARVTGGGAVSGEVTLTGPAAASGITLTLISKLPAPDPEVRVAPGVRQAPLVGLPAQITIAAGAGSATFQLTTRPVTAATPVQLTASLGAFNTKTATLTIVP